MPRIIKIVARGIVSILYLLSLALLGGMAFAATGGDSGFVRTILLIGVFLTFFGTKEAVLSRIGLAKPVVTLTKEQTEFLETVKKGE